MDDHPISCVGMLHWIFRIVGGQGSDQSGGDRHIRRNMPSNNVIHGFSHGQPVGRCSVSLGRSRQSVGEPKSPFGGWCRCSLSPVPVLAFASAGSAVSVAAARVRLKAITAQTSHAAFAQKCADGMCASAEFFRSACTCSMIACRRWTLSGATVSSSARSVVVKNVWNRHAWNSRRCP